MGLRIKRRFLHSVFGNLRKLGFTLEPAAVFSAFPVDFRFTVRTQLEALSQLLERDSTGKAHTFVPLEQESVWVAGAGNSERSLRPVEQAVRGAHTRLLTRVDSDLHPGLEPYPVLLVA